MIFKTLLVNLCDKNSLQELKIAKANYAPRNATKCFATTPEIAEVPTEMNRPADMSGNVITQCKYYV